MKQNTKKEIANKTLIIIESGIYNNTIEDVDVKKMIESSYNETYFIAPNQIDLNSKIVAEEQYQTEIEVYNTTTIESIAKEYNHEKIAVLNFASAKNPGGGFLGGASAQEESLARSSSLYHSLLKCMNVYQFNRNESTYLYSDYMIYSPNTVFWFDDNGYPFKDPYLVDVITSAAPNRGAMLQNNKLNELEYIESTFKRRIELVLRLALDNKVKTLILGAWGCGVFRNNTEDVARYFKEVIDEKFENKFKKIVFAVYDSSENKKTFSDFKLKFSET